SYAATEKAVARLEEIFEQYPELEHVSLEIGSEPMTLPYFTGSAGAVVNGATAMITLSDMEERERSIWEVFDAIHAEATASLPGLRRLSLKEMGADVMASSAAPVQMLVYGKDLNVVSQLGEEVARLARQTKGMHQVSTSWTMGQPDFEVRVDPRRAAEVGLTPDEVASQAYYAMKGGYTNEFYRLPNRRQTTILVRYDEAERRPAPDDLEQLLIATPGGGQVPLATLASLEMREAPTAIEHDGMRRVVSVVGYYRLGGPYSMDLTMEVMMKAMAQLNWPPGYGLEVRGDMTQMMDSFARLLRGLVLALIFIFLVLVAQFRGFVQPAQMIFSLPLELSGVFVALWLAHQAFSTVSIMAVIVLTGMDVTTAILLIDQIMRFREEGMPRNPAVIAACPTRLRPILMTSLITLVVMVPVAFFPKTGMDAYSPLGTVVVGGLLMGTVLSLLDIPIMHTLVDDVQRWWLVKVRRRDPATLPPLEYPEEGSPS
ncbi:MAG: efflux RND transporter permease subunit, partial [Kofleriaceae bacterium]|nr:efflux RND transporter permease subunit [Kofleriaceae bacterium]